MTKKVIVGRSSYVFLVVLALAAVVAGLTWAFWPIWVLEIRGGWDDQPIKIVPVAIGDRITYSYLHSVQKTPVDEVIEISAGGHLTVREAVYGMFGAGLPSDLPDGTFSVDEAQGKFHISNMSRELPTPWRIRVAFTPGQTIEIHGEKLNLASLVSPTKELAVDVVRRPRLIGDGIITALWRRVHALAAG